jgi:excisionase family DNA binding protein
MRRVTKPVRGRTAPHDNDFLWGCGAIARYLGITERKAYYLLEENHLPHKKLGRRIVALKSELASFLHSSGGRQP